MNTPRQTNEPERRISQIIESARALGVEMDEHAAIQWLTAVAAAETGERNRRLRGMGTCVQLGYVFEGPSGFEPLFTGWWLRSLDICTVISPLRIAMNTACALSLALSFRRIALT